MTIAEFKAWLEGYSANMGAAPTADQWKEIIAKIGKLQAVTVEPIWTKYFPSDRGPIWDYPSYKDNHTVPLRAH